MSCEQSVNEEKAEVSEPKEVKEPQPEAIPFIIRNSSSEINWVGKKPTGKHSGTLGIESGQFDVLNGKIDGASIRINMDDIEVHDLKSDEDSHMKLTEHLRSKDFFDVQNHPFSTFELTNILPYDSVSKSERDIYAKQNKAFSLYELKNPTHQVTGNLTIRGTTLNISFPAYITIQEDEITASAEFNIDRTRWNIKHNEEANFADKAQDQLIYNEVKVGFYIIANPEKEVL